jgi:hypothetical protein
MRQFILIERHRLTAVLSVCAAAALLSGCSRKDISERPPVDTGAGAAPIVTQPSTIGALVTIPFAQAIQATNTALPSTYGQDWTNGPDSCVNIPIVGRQCAGTRYRFNVARGPIAIEPVAPASIKLSVPVSVSGQGGFRGDGARLLGLDAKNFDAAAKFDIVVTPKIGADWCPSFNVVPTYAWTSNPRVEIVSRVNVDISGQVSDVLNGKIPEITRAIQSSINCDQFKAQLASVYGKRTFPIEVTPGQKMHVNLEPSAFAFSGLTVDAQAIRLAALLTAKIDVSATPLVAAPLPLPPLQPIGPSAPPRISIAVPLRAPFELLQTEAQKLLGGKTFEGTSPAGSVKATVNKVEIYPTTGGKLAIGIEFDAKLPSSFLDTKGTVFVIGTPAAEGPTQVRIKDPTFTRILDNDVWNGLSALFDGKIRGELDKNLRYNFAADVEKAKKALADKLADPATLANVKASVTNVDIGLGRVGVNGKDLVAEALFGANVSLEPNLGALVAQK